MTDLKCVICDEKADYIYGGASYCREHYLERQKRVEEILDDFDDKTSKALHTEREA